MRSPRSTPTEPVDDLARDLAELLKPYRYKWEDQLKQDGDSRYTARWPYTEQEVRAAARERIEMLKGAMPFLSRKGIRQTREDARKIAATARVLQAQLRTASPEFRAWLMLDSPKSYQGPFPGQQIGILRLRRELDDVLEICAEAIRTSPTTDPVKKTCSYVAVGLHLSFSAGSPTIARINEIASLLFAAVTDARETGLERACRAALRDWIDAIKESNAAKPPAD